MPLKSYKSMSYGVFHKNWPNRTALALDTANVPDVLCKINLKFFGQFLLKCIRLL